MAPAPVDKIDHNVIEGQLQDIVQDLYELMVQTHAYDNVGPGVRSREVLQKTIDHLSTSLITLHQTASSPSMPHIRIPPELIQYVDVGRNPDIYTREFVELARRGNQLMRGKMEAFGDFRDTLAREMGTALPELRADVVRVVDATGGRGDVVVSAVAAVDVEAESTSADVNIKTEGS